MKTKKNTSYKTNLLRRVYEKKHTTKFNNAAVRGFLLLCLSTNSKPSIIVKDNVEFLELQNFYATYILTRINAEVHEMHQLAALRKRAVCIQMYFAKRASGHHVWVLYTPELRATSYPLILDMIPLK